MTHPTYHWTPDMDERLLRKRAEGQQFRLIAASLDVSLATAALRYYQLCREKGVKPAKVTHKRHSKAVRETVIEMRRNGALLRQIADAVHLRRHQVSHICADARMEGVLK